MRAVCPARHPSGFGHPNIFGSVLVMYLAESETKIETTNFVSLSLPRYCQEF
jgi:hypothetical protein